MLIAKQLSVLICIFSACYLFLLVQAKEDRLHDCPQLMLWAWERPENIEWINPRKVGVAFLARTLNLNEESVSVYKRKQPLSVPPCTYMMAVVRIESNAHHLPKFSDSQVDSIVKAILASGGDESIKALQIDFDARESERIAYRRILQRVRSLLPEHVGLSMTALASWCAGDRWLEQLPVDEIVPMYFRMGAIGGSRQEYLDSWGPSVPSAPLDFKSSRLSSYLHRHRSWCNCDKSIGIATDEFVDRKFTSNRRVYVFSPRAWARQQIVTSIDSSRF
jgi:hypothetical protein